MLYALLNGGAPYLIRDAAYPNIDGAFEAEKEVSLQEQIQRCNVVCELHEKVAKCELVYHKIIDGDYMQQESVFSDGTKVMVDFRKQTYKIDYGK